MGETLRGVKGSEISEELYERSGDQEAFKTKCAQQSIILRAERECTGTSGYHSSDSLNVEQHREVRFFSSTTTPQSPPLTSLSSSTRSLPLISATAGIHPCSVCGEILPSPSLLDHHRSIHHPISELADDENIVRIIFKTGWPDSAKSPTIHRILKIHSCSKIVSRFEEYRERVKSRAAAARPKSTPRCIADGNEQLRFQCTTFACELDSGVCGRVYCSVCGIIRSGFSPKMDGISTMPTSHAAHVTLPEGIEEEFGFMNVKRAVLVCRVVAGRVGCDPCEVDKEDPGFDSVVGESEEELLVFNPRAVLPCFAILYTI